MSLSLLVVLGVSYLFGGEGSLATLWANVQAPLPSGRGLVTALFFGFAISMLGISGFESSSNFVEEQAEGVFPKTLRNMWVAVSMFNPLMAVLALSLVPLDGVPTYKETLLSHMGAVAGWGWLSALISIDAGFEAKIEGINAQQFVFFTRGDNIANINEAMLYVRCNEQTKRIKVATVVKDDGEVTSALQRDLEFLDKAYPDIDIEFVVVHGVFGPLLIQKLEKEWNIPANFMFIGSPGDHFLYGLAELGGVRLII